ncbi:MAG: hypothetical protein DRO13_01340 [Thermoprotei archaeon]|nr:MAG: hypothetical protein DRO13_01340 [Thermoprotei archaeon]
MKLAQSNSELLELAKRMLNAFKHFECFIFEKRELEAVKKLLRETGLNRHLLLRRADPRYEHIYVLLPWRIEFEQECLASVKRLLAEGRVDQDYYKKNYKLLITQCIKHFEREKVKEVISILRDYINRVSGGF